MKFQTEGRLVDLVFRATRETIEKPLHIFENEM